MKKNALISSVITVMFLLVAGCGGTANKEIKSMTIDFSMAYGNETTDNANLNKVALLKVDGSFGATDAKPDASTGASTPEGATAALNAYRYVNVKKYKETTSVPDALRGLLLYGVASANTYFIDGLSGNEYSQKIITDTNNNVVTGPKVSGTVIKKETDGSILIRYSHAGGADNVKPTIYELKSDVNGVFAITKDTTNIKKSAKAIEVDTDFASVELVSDEIKGTIPYWEGELQGTFENNILTLKGTLTLKE